MKRMTRQSKLLTMTAPRRAAFAALVCLAAALPSASKAQSVPVFEITPQTSALTFFVNSSVAVEGKFDKWNATLVFTSTDPTSGVLDIQIQAASVDTGSGLKDGKLKGSDFFDVKNNPLIKFHSTKVVQTGPNTFEVDGDFTIRGVTKQEKLSLAASGIETVIGEITDKMSLNRKDNRV